MHLWIEHVTWLKFDVKNENFHFFIFRMDFLLSEAVVGLHWTRPSSTTLGPTGGNFSKVLCFKADTETDLFRWRLNVQLTTLNLDIFFDLFIMGQFDHVLHETLTDLINRMITGTKESMLSRDILVLVHFGWIWSHYLKHKIYCDHIDWHPPNFNVVHKWSVDSIYVKIMIHSYLNWNSLLELDFYLTVT